MDFCIYRQANNDKGIIYIEKMENKNIIDLGDRGKYHKGNKLNNLTGKEWLRFTKSWEIVNNTEESFFIINPKPRNENVILHPAKFPEELVVKLIDFFTKESEIVFDPFLGTGSTLVAAQMRNRKGIGVELNPKYAEITKERINSLFADNFIILTGNSENLLTLKNENELTISEILKTWNTDFVDCIITSPPYWDMLKNSRGNIETLHKKHIKKGGDEFYSSLENDLGNLNDYKEYLDKLIKIFTNCYEILKPNGYLVIVIQNIRIPNGKMIPLAWELAIKLSEKYELRQEKVWLQDNKQLNIWGYPSSYVSNVHHHYCIVLQKINNKNVPNIR